MAAELQEQLAASSLYDTESLKAFNQMYTAQNPYMATGFDKNYPTSAAAVSAFPFFAQHFTPYSTPNASSFSPSSSSASSTSSQAPRKKKPVPVPDSQKDDKYFISRRRNNEAARKSREARKKQDADNGIRVGQLEAENHSLRAQLYRLVHENMMMRQQLVQHFPGAIDPNAAMPTF